MKCGRATFNRNYVAKPKHELQSECRLLSLKLRWIYLQRLQPPRENAKAKPAYPFLTEGTLLQHHTKTRGQFCCRFWKNAAVFMEPWKKQRLACTVLLWNLTDDRAFFIANFNRRRRGHHSQHVASANEVAFNAERSVTTSDGLLPVFCIVLWWSLKGVFAFCAIFIV